MNVDDVAYIWPIISGRESEHSDTLRFSDSGCYYARICNCNKLKHTGEIIAFCLLWWLQDGRLAWKKGYTHFRPPTCTWCMTTRRYTTEMYTLFNGLEKLRVTPEVTTAEAAIHTAPLWMLCSLVTNSNSATFLQFFNNSAYFSFGFFKINRPML